MLYRSSAPFLPSLIVLYDSISCAFPCAGTYTYVRVFLACGPRVWKLYDVGGCPTMVRARSFFICARLTFVRLARRQADFF
ncbi:hypothetical protein B0H19DRAFT_1185861, partial [Mycena capillaripes]